MTGSPAVVRPDVERALERLLAELREAAGENLLGVALYGGLAKGRYTPGISDINVLVVLRTAGLPELVSISGPLTAARRGSRVATFIVTPSDLRVAARLFPVKIADIKRAHRTLWGDVGLTGVTVDAGALRHRALQELSNMLFRLRQRAAERGAEPAVLWGGLLQSLPKLTVTLEVLLGERLTVPTSDRGTVLRAAGRTLGIGDALDQFADIHRSAPRPPDAEVAALVSAYLELLARLAAQPASNAV